MWLKRINSKKFTLCVILSAWSVKIYDLIQCLLVTISFHSSSRSWRNGDRSKIIYQRD